MKLVISHSLNSIKRFVLLVTLGVFTSPASAIAVFDDFENIGGFIPGSGETNFNIGTANFTGGVSGIARIPELYKSGNHAWMVKGRETGIIQFGPNTTEVSFYAKAFSGADNSSVITAFDNANNVIDSLTLTASGPFTKFTATGLINRIEFFNNDSDGTRMNSLDDFSVTTVPVPGAFWLFGTAILGVVGYSKKSIST